MSKPVNISKTTNSSNALLNFQIMLFDQRSQFPVRRVEKRGRFVFLILIGLASSSPLSPKKMEPTQICQNLTREFDRNEAKMALIHDVNRSVFEAERKFREAVNDQRSRSDELQALKQITADDQIHLIASDRIVTLILANKCVPPDHVANWFTYSETNPNRKLPSE